MNVLKWGDKGASPDEAAEYIPSFAHLGVSLGLSSLSKCLHQLFHMKLTKANQPVWSADAPQLPVYIPVALQV